MDLLLLAVRLFLAAVFAAAGFGKLFDPAGSRQSMIDFGAPRALAPMLALLLPIAELGCAAALIPVSTAWWGAAGVLGMLVLFVAAIVINLARGRRPDCHCFGQLHSEPVGWKTIARNTVLGAIAGSVLWRGPSGTGASLRAWVAGLSRIEAVVAILALTCIGLAAFTVWSLFHLLRQNGRMLLRLEAVEGKLGINPNAPKTAGLPVDTPAPEFSLAALEGGTVTLAGLSEGGLPVLLIFADPSCGACESLLPDVAEWQRKHTERLSIAVISRGSEEANRAKSGNYGLRNTLLEKEREVSQAYGVEANPSGVLVVDGKIANELAVGGDAIRGLVARMVLPRVTKGDAAPALRLPDLNGKPVDLAEMKGRRSLLLFWSTSCGFCQQMLPELKKWEQTPLIGGPRLVVLSSGAEEDNRRQGFRAPVLLDNALAAMHVFGASGTPSAVMLDEQGRVASGVEVGADAVLSLAGVVRVAAR